MERALEVYVRLYDKRCPVTCPTDTLQLLSRVQLVHTAKHGSWLNMAEPELEVLTRQCLDKRISEGERVA